jgi:hypothetical protein
MTWHGAFDDDEGTVVAIKSKIVFKNKSYKVKFSRFVNGKDNYGKPIYIDEPEFPNISRVVALRRESRSRSRSYSRDRSLFKSPSIRNGLPRFRSRSRSRSRSGGTLKK